MTRRTRILVFTSLTVLVVGGVLGYMVGRARQWHQRGWSGVSYLFGPSQAQQAKLMGLSPYQVYLTASGSPADGRLRYRDEILTIGGVDRGDVKALAALDARTKVGSTVVYRIRRGNRILDVPLRFESPLRSGFVVLRHLVALVVGLTFVGIALVIIIRAPNDTRATVFYAMALLSCVTILLGVATMYEQMSGRGIITSPVPSLTSLYVVGMAAFMYPPLILHLALIFPRRRPVVERRPVVIRWLYAVALLTVATMLMALTLIALMDWQNMGAGQERFKSFFTQLWYAFVGTSMALSLYVIWAARREGLWNAVVQRPFIVSFAGFGLLFGLTRTALRFVSALAGGITAGLMTGLPLLILASFPVLALVALIRSHREANVEEKRQVAWPLWGLLVSVGAKILRSSSRASSPSGLPSCRWT